MDSKLIFINKTQYTFIFKWLLIAILVGVTVGSASAFFLKSLEFVENLRENNTWIIYFLPIAGLSLVYLYKKLGDGIEKESDLLIEQANFPSQKIPLKLAPLVFTGTLITHLFGGSAGREGTAVQMGGAIADQLKGVFKLNPDNRKVLLICGISAGFSSVFGTPLAGAIFALEVLVIGKLYYKAIVPSLIAAVLADFVCDSRGVIHTQYFIAEVPELSTLNLTWTLLAGLLFGLVGFVYPVLKQKTSSFLKSKIVNEYYRVIIGSVFIVLFFVFSGTKYLGLGIQTISDSFINQKEIYVFIFKTIVTLVTLSIGFKGGEVTPLFFIGATLGSAMSIFFGLPVGLLAGMGFVAVFSGATNTPLACSVLGIELFGVESAIFIVIACYTAYLFSGQNSIYNSQIKGDKFNF